MKTILTLTFVAIIGAVFALAGGEGIGYGGFPGASGFDVNKGSYFGGQGTNFGTNAANYNNYNQNTQAYNNQIGATSYTPYSSFGAAFEGPAASNYAASQYFNPIIVPQIPYGGFGYGAGFGAAPYLGGGFGYGAGFGGPIGGFGYGAGFGGPVGGIPPVGIPPVGGAGFGFGAGVTPFIGGAGFGGPIGAGVPPIGAGFGGPIGGAPFIGGPVGGAGFGAGVGGPIGGFGFGAGVGAGPVPFLKSDDKAAATDAGKKTF
ncbi:hypothetical protein ABK040_015046 [Willaertia magna]